MNILNSWLISYDNKKFSLKFAFYDSTKHSDSNATQIDEQDVEDIKAIEINPLILKGFIVDLINKGLEYEDKNKVNLGIHDLIVKEGNIDE